MRKQERVARDQRLARIRLLSDELDRLRLSALERTRSIDTKASFVVVAAGVIATASFEGLTNSRTWLLSLLPVVLTIVTVVVAAFALWPVKLESASGRDVVDEWVDADLTPADLEDSLLEVKTVEIEFRDAKNESKATATKWAFGLLVASLVVALLATAASAVVTNGGLQIGETVITTPAPTPTEAP